MTEWTTQPCPYWVVPGHEVRPVLEPGHPKDCPEDEHRAEHVHYHPEFRCPTDCPTRRTAP